MLEKSVLDVVLVPAGIVSMLLYHVYLVYRIIQHPNSTVIGFENGNKKIWVHKMMENMPKNTGIALQVISSNISAATYLISLSITLTSLIGTIVGSNSTTTNTTTDKAKRLADEIIYGDRSLSAASVKYASLMLCFLIAFMAHVQCIRYYIHVSFLISTPGSSVSAHYVENAVIRGSNFWSLGLRAYYFAFPLLLWIFGPIPMFTCCLGMVSFLYFLDSKDNPIPPFPFPFAPKEQRHTVLCVERGDMSTGHAIESSTAHHTLGSIMMADVELQHLQLQCNS